MGPEKRKRRVLAALQDLGGSATIEAISVRASLNASVVAEALSSSPRFFEASSAGYGSEKTWRIKELTIEP